MGKPATPVDGFCDPAFERVREAFRNNFSAHDEIGAAVTVCVGRREVVDLWGGWRDAAQRHPWTASTIVNSYSVGKGITALLALALVGQRRLSLDAKVAEVWPAFGAGGNAPTTLRELLSHRAGLPALRQPMENADLGNWGKISDALAHQDPWWEPGTAHGYHVNTFGFLVGELIRRATGAASFRRALQEALCGPLEAEFHVGLPMFAHRLCAEICGAAAQPIEPDAIAAFVVPPDTPPTQRAMRALAYNNPPALSGLGVVNSSWWRSIEVPSTNGHGTARGVARLYAEAITGGLFPESLLAEACTAHSEGIDRVLGRSTRFGLGFQLPEKNRPMGPGTRTFGHFGYGGSLGFGDPDSGISFAYLMNRPGDRWQSPRSESLIDAVYACVGS